MKRISLMIGAAAIAATATAAEPSWVMFSSEGPDLYADGTTVENGEYYALVYSEGAGSVFKGFDTIGNLVDPAQDKIIGIAPLADNGGCPPVVFIVDEGGFNPYTNGVMKVYLLDTRVKAADGTTESVGARDAETGDFVSVGGYEPVNANITLSSITNVGDGSAFTGENAVATALPSGDYESVPIVDFTVDEPNDQVIVSVSNTLKSVRYTVAGGETIGALNDTRISGVNGAGEGKILNLVFKNPALNRFFKVVRGK